MKIKVYFIEPEEMTLSEIRWYLRGIYDKKPDKKILKRYKDLLKEVK